MNTVVTPDKSLEGLRGLRDHLLKDIMPFWINNAIDASGGLNNCIGDDGKVQSRDKWLWSQWRAVWVFSHLYRTVQAKNEWLEVAKGIAGFCIKHGWLEDEAGWALLLDGDGNIQRGYESIYVDAFAMYGLSELYRITGRDEYADYARRTADSVLQRLQQPHDSIPHYPYPIPEGARVHGIPMILSLKFWELAKALDEPRYRDVAVSLSDEVFNDFYRPDRDLLLERISADGGEYPAPQGTTVVPGHVIESMWFQLHIAMDRKDQKRIDQSIGIIQRHLELGWDDKYGGILLAVDADGGSEVGWGHPDSKVWWPQTEAMYALLLANELSGEDWCMEWYWRVHEYSLSRYPVSGIGEWRQRLKRDGSPLDEVVCLPVKDPFHLPRALMFSLESLERQNKNNHIQEKV